MTLLIFLLILSLLVLVHELGHFIVAKKSGVKVEEFGIGFPPRIFSIKYGETIYSINLLFFGGFVRLYGEEEKVAKETARAFSQKPKRIRAAIITAGVVMNFLLAVFAFSVLYSVVGIPRKSSEVQVVGISPGSPAQKAGLSIEDIVLSVDGERVQSNEMFIQLIEKRKGKDVVLELRSKNGEGKNVKVLPRESPPEGEGALGVAITDTKQYFPPFWQRPFWGIFYGFQEAFLWGKQTLLGVGMLISRIFTQGKLPEELAGPVGIFQLTGIVSQQGFLALLHFLGVLSINLGILNILPFPALDGGRLLFVIVEAVFRGRARQIIPKVERITNMVGFVLLIALILAITLQDIRRIVGQ